jgi:MFS family permease
MVAAFADTLGSFLILALIPYYALELGASAFEVGILVAAFALAQTITAPLWGRLSDRWGRRPVILIGLAIGGLSFLIFAWADSLWMLLISRLAQGIGGGTVSVLFAYVADVFPAHLRAERIGWLTAATSAAAMIGPALGSMVARYDPSFPGLLAALLNLIALVLAAVLLIEPATIVRVAPVARTSLRRALARVALHPRETVSALIWCYAVAMLASSAMTGIIGLFLEQRFAVGRDRIWIFFVVLAGASLVVRVTILGPLVRQWGEVRVIRLGTVSLAAGLLLAPAAPSFTILLVPTLLFAIGQSFVYPCTTALVSHQAPSGSQVGEVLGVQQAFGGLSRMSGPVVAGLLFGALGPAAPFLVFGVAVSALLLWTRTASIERLAR